MSKKHKKYVHVGEYVAEVEVELVESDTGWSPYLSKEDACKLDDVRDALRRNNIDAASRVAKVFTLRPVVP